MKRKLKGSFTIEASVIVPVILIIFSLIIMMLFYFHDKNLVAALSHETLVMGCAKEDINTEELEQYLQMRIHGKLLIFEKIDVAAETDADKVMIICSARKKGMSLHVEVSMKRTDPQEYIWKLRRMDKVKEGLGKE